MTASWTIQLAKSQLSRVVDLAINVGPQTVTRCGIPVVVVTAVAPKKVTRSRRGTANQLLALLRSCPADLTTIVQRDRSLPR